MKTEIGQFQKKKREGGKKGESGTKRWGGKEEKERKRKGRNKFAFDTFENSGNRSKWQVYPVKILSVEGVEGERGREGEQSRTKEGENGCKITNDLLATWTGV